MKGSYAQFQNDETDKKWILFLSARNRYVCAYRFYKHNGGLVCAWGGSGS